MKALSLAIVGANHPNKRGPTRIFGIGLCAAGDPIELRREPNNQFDEFAIAAYAQGIQIGYVLSERAVFLAPMLDRGREIAAIFQERTRYGCAVRIAFDGEAPTLPPPGEASGDAPDFVPDDDRGFYPDHAPDE